MSAAADDATAAASNAAARAGGSRPLHNFYLPPRLSWGAHRLLRCSKSTATPSSSLSPPPPKSAHSLRRTDEGDHIHAFGEKLLTDFRSKVENMHANLLYEPVSQAPSPWNLRSRRAASNDDKKRVASPVRQEVVALPAPRPKFSVALTKQEIEDDFIAMTGRRPPRKPKRRPRYVQKPMDTMFPGLWLSEVNANMYKVNENPEPPK